MWQRLALALPAKRVAVNLSVDVSTVNRILRLFETTGSVDKKSYNSTRSFRKITEPAKFFIIYLVMDRPGILLREIREELISTLGITVTESAVCTFLHQAGFTRQRLKLYALQQDEGLRRKFALDVSMFNVEMLVFLDESGCDNCDSLRKKGYSLRGKPARKQRLFVRGEHVSVLCTMSVEGILSCNLVRGGVNGEKFIEFIEMSVMPTLMPFNGINPRSIIIMDNCAIHHIPEVTDLIQQTGALIYWLPPYSPDLNPIEEAFSKAKAMMKAMEYEMQILMDIDTIVYSAFSAITAEDCEQWIADSHIYNI